MSLATVASLMPASSSALCSRLANARPILK
jgi:hypothetical protein